MRFEVNSQAFSEAARRVAQHVSGHQPLAALGGMHLVAGTDSVVVRGSDLDVEVAVETPASVDEPGEAVIPAKVGRWLQMVAGEGKIKVAYDGEGMVALKAPEGEAALRTVPTKPPAKEKAEGSGYPVEAARLAAGLRRVRHAVSGGGGPMGGVLAEVAKDGLTLTATDSYRLARVHLGGKRGEADAVMPRRFCDVVEGARDVTDARIWLDRDGPLEFRGTDWFGTIGVVTRPVSGQYPNLENVLAGIPDGGVWLGTQELKEALGRLAPFAAEAWVGAEFEPEELRLVADSHQIGRSAVRIPYVEGPIRGLGGFAVDHRLLLDAVDGCGGEKLRLFHDGGPIWLADETGEGWFLVMPLRKAA